MLQAVILAAGSSTRTLPLTATRPKPLLPLLGKPLLQHLLEQISDLADEAILVVGYRADSIRRHFGERFGALPLRYVEQEEPRGTADALRRAAPLIKERCLVVNGDDLYHRHDLRALLRHRTGLLVAHAPDPQNRAVVTISGDQVVDIVEKPASPAHSLCSVGGYTLERAALRLLDEIRESPRGELEIPDLIRRLTRHSLVRYHRVERIWLPITYPWDLLTTTLFLLEEPARARQFGVEVAGLGQLKRRRDINLGVGTVVEEPVLIGAGVTFGNFCRIRGPAVIAEGSRLGDCVELDRSVLFRAAQVGEFARISHSVLGELVRIESQARTLAEPEGGGKVRAEVAGKMIDTGLPRLGLIAGDRAVVMSGAAVPAGRKLAPGETFGEKTVREVA